MLHVEHARYGPAAPARGKKRSRALGVPVWRPVGGPCVGRVPPSGCRSETRGNPGIRARCPGRTPRSRAHSVSHGRLRHPATGTTDPRPAAALAGPSRSRGSQPVAPAPCGRLPGPAVPTGPQRSSRRVFAPGRDRTPIVTAGCSTWNGRRHGRRSRPGGEARAPNDAGRLPGSQQTRAVCHVAPPGRLAYGSVHQVASRRPGRRAGRGPGHAPVGGRSSNGPGATATTCTEWNSSEVSWPDTSLAGSLGVAPATASPGDGGPPAPETAAAPAAPEPPAAAPGFAPAPWRAPFWPAARGTVRWRAARAGRARPRRRRAGSGGTART
jgi:hypothetical protein